MRELNTWQNALFRTGGLMMVAGAALVRLHWACSALLAVGVLLFVPMLMLMRYEGRNIVIQRLRRQQLLGGVFFLLSAAALCMQTFRFGPLWAHRNAWLLCFAIGCVLLLYTAFRIPTELDKEKNR